MTHDHFNWTKTVWGNVPYVHTDFSLLAYVMYMPNNGHYSFSDDNEFEYRKQYTPIYLLEDTISRSIIDMCFFSFVMKI